MNKMVEKKKKALIIGAAGFVGGYLATELAENGYEVFCTKMQHEEKTNPFLFYDLDILNLQEIETLLAELCPDYIFHLAAQSSVGSSWKNPDLTLDVNIKGSTHLLQAVHSSGGNPKILLIGSGEEYGMVRPEDVPVTENTLPRPGNIYAASKVAQNMMGAIYAKAYDMQAIMVRAFNHIGPLQTPTFVVADFCKQVAEIEAGKQEPIIRVGNLSAVRNFTDVRDVVKAYAMLIEKGTAGETYNVGSPKSIAIQNILEMILSSSTAKITVEVDPDKLRPIDVPVVEVDTSKIQKATGWKPEISIQQTIQETLNHWREIV